MKITVERFETALTGTYGNLSVIARKLNVSRTTLYKWLEQNKEAAEKLQDVRESFDDNVESILQKKLIEGDSRMLEFYARTRLKKRGYSESFDINVREMPKLVVNLSQSDE